ncbi:MAG: hypothetical protein HY829_10810 [Actinobacteria bacterium]|nr:hypothetical protein [Actinomycetota bacterium]
MFRNLAAQLGGPAKLFALHPVQLHRYLETAWTQMGLVQIGADTENVFLGEDENIVALLSRAPNLLDDPFITGLPTGRRPWEHLIYAYLLENTGMMRIFKRVVELYAVGEQLDVPSPVTRQWLRTAEELLFTNPPPFGIGSLASDVRPDLEATRRNAYWRLLGMDLDHGGSSGRPYPYPRVTAANVDFVPQFESLLGEVWQNYINRVNTSGENASDPEAVANRADILAKGLRVRRLRGNLAREEFFFTAVLSWFHVTLESDNDVIADLKATAADPSERLQKLGARVGITAHPRARNLILMAEPASSLLRFVELEKFSTEAGAATLYAPTGAIKDDALTVINHWGMATGRNLKARRTTTGIPATNGVPARVRPGPAQPRSNGSSPVPVNGRTSVIPGRN